MLSSIQKIMTKILTQKINNKVYFQEEQQGFRTNRSTIDAIFILRQLIEKAIEFNKPMFTCFVDLEKAFDRVRLNDVITLLKQNNVDKRHISVIRELNSNNKTRIKTSQGLTQGVEVAIGIRQGDSLSPCQFNIIMDQIIRGVNEVKAGYKMGNRSLRILCYADDAVLVAENEDDLQRLLNKFKTAAERFNMLISRKKNPSNGDRKKAD